MRHDRISRFSAVCLFGLLLSAHPCPAAETTLSSGIDRAGFDTSIKPGDDFFRYVNGTWIKHNPIPPEYGRWGSFFKLRDDNLLALREILDDLAKTDKKLDGNRAKLRDFYRTAMDEAKLRASGGRAGMIVAPSCGEVGGPEGTYLVVGPRVRRWRPSCLTMCGPGWK